MYFYPERVSVQARAFVPVRNVRQVMSSFNLKYAENIHGRIVPSTRKCCKAIRF